MTREFYDFGNFRQLLDEEGEEELQNKEIEDFKNIWEPSKDENSFYKEMRDLIGKQSIDVVLPKVEGVKKDNHILFPQADGSYKLMISDTPGKSLQGLCPTVDNELDNQTDIFPKLLKERQFSKEQYKLSGLFRIPGKKTLVQTAMFPGPCEFKTKPSNFLDKSQSILVGLLIQYKGPYICPITKKEYFNKPYFYDHLKDIDDFIRAVYDEVVFIYEHSFLYEENNYACIPFSELLRLEKEYRKRWDKIKKTRKKKLSTNATHTVAKSSCWVIRRLLKQYKYYIHLKYLRKLFVMNKGNSVTYRIT